MASTTVLATLLIATWRHTKSKSSSLDNQQPPPLTKHPMVNQVAPLTTITLAVINEHSHLLLLALLGFFLLSLLSTLTLALIVPLLLCLTIHHLEREHQWAFNITTTAQCPLPHTTTNLPVVAANRDSNNPTQQESDDSSLEFLNKGGFRYPFTPLPNVTHQLFLIPGLPESSNSDTIVLHQFPGPLEILPNTLEASTGSYHVAPAQVFPSLSPMNTSSSPNPDSPLAASTDSPNMPPLTSDASDNGSLDHAPNLHLLANISKSWQSIPFDTSTPVQDVDPLEQVLPHFPGVYANFVTRPPMGVSINGIPAFGLQRVSTTTANILRTAEPVGNWNSLDKEWEKDTWEYLQT
ncbi:uncharacterized protein FIBRA_09363 [Fibroporia radiculosa]|uniref:Uncharacterized protein n=1 Tax=Fibroporia radiculosa TaxID=599839 RepID=J7SCZ2_9APHY|nr:uncharacterized protein FIBRA_09363 [Fibroporia radiculosa]CCM07043.1 predicted protein [Fibroporia radiculosa]